MYILVFDIEIRSSVGLVFQWYDWINNGNVIENVTHLLWYIRWNVKQIQTAVFYKSQNTYLFRWLINDA